MELNFYVRNHFETEHETGATYNKEYLTAFVR